MIHLLGWAAVIAQASYSYQTRPFPPGKDHRAELPAIGYAAAMLLALILAAVLVGAEPPAAAQFPRRVIWVPVV